MSALIIKFIQQLISLLEALLDWSQRRKPAKGWTIGLAVTVTIIVVLMMVRGIAADQPDQDGDPASKAKSSSVTIPLLIGYQGRLADPGTGEAKPDGNYNVEFSLYDVESGGTALWNESKIVSVGNGVFSTHLGDITPLSISLFNGQALWLGIKVESDAEATPRQVLAVVPYAISLVPGATISGDSGSPIFSVENNSTLALAHAIYGSIPSSSPGGSSTAVRGENKGTGGLGIGVWGSHAGSGWGVYGSTTSGGLGVYGSSPSGIGVYGWSSSGTGVYAQSSSGNALYASGDARVTGDLTVNGTLSGFGGSLPIAFAHINSTGSKDSGTANVSSIWNSSSQRYEITISGHSYFFSSYVTVVTVSGCANYTTRTGSVSGKLLVYIYNSSGSPAQCHFQFVTYKP